MLVYDSRPGPWRTDRPPLRRPRRDRPAAGSRGRVDPVGPERSVSTALRRILGEAVVLSGDLRRGRRRGQIRLTFRAGVMRLDGRRGDGRRIGGRRGLVDIAL